MTDLELRQARHRYSAAPVLDGVDLTVGEGCMLAVLGASGSGKTTLLRVVAGFERLESGELRLGGRVVDDGHRAVPPERRRIGYVPQEGALFPHLRVGANVAFGLGRRAGRRRASELLDLVGLSGMEQRYPHELSGGQQQRVALARALAVSPEIVLLDEPFSALDAALRASVRDEVAAILRRHGTTTVLVTHDQDEALSMSDRVAVLRRGRIVTEGPPEQLYRRPADPEMAAFLGEANLLPARAGSGTVDTALGRLVVMDGVKVSGEATVLVRPEQLELRSRSAAPASGGTPGQVVERTYFGHDALVRVRISGRAGTPAQPVVVRVTGVSAPQPGEEVLLTVRGPVMAWPSGGDGRG